MLVGFLLLALLSYVLLRTPFVQTRLVKYVTNRIEHNTGAKIQIGGVALRPMKSLVLNDVLLRDFRQDTLFYCANLKIKLDSFRFFNQSFNAREITLDRAFLNLWMDREPDDDDSVFNLGLFVNSLQDTTALAKESSGMLNWVVGLEKIHLRNTRLVYKEHDYIKNDYGINWTDISCFDIHADFSNPVVEGTHVSLQTDNLKLREKSGFRIKDLQAFMELTYEKGNLTIRDIQLQTDKSRVNVNRLEYNWNPQPKEWRYFISRVEHAYELAESRVSFEDLAYFNERLLGMDNVADCSGFVYGTVDRLSGKDLLIDFGKGSRLGGSFTSSGLPLFLDTDFDIQISQAYLLPEDLETIYLPWMGRRIAIPSVLHRTEGFGLENVHFTGKVDSFNLKTHSSTPDLGGNLELAYVLENSQDSIRRLSGNFNFPDINVNKYSGLPFIGEAKASGTFTGTFGETDSRAELLAEVQRCRFYRGDIKDMGIRILYDNGKVNLTSLAENESLRADFSLEYTAEPEVVMVSKGQLKIEDLEYFGFSAAGKKLGANFSLSYTEDEENRGEADYLFSNIFGMTETDTFCVNRIVLHDRFDKEIHETSLLSDVVDMNFRGNSLSLLSEQLWYDLIAGYLPAYGRGQKTEEYDFPDFRYDIRFKDADRVLRVLLPELSIAADTRLQTVFDEKKQFVSLDFLSDSIRYKDMAFQMPRVKMYGDPERLQVKTTFDRVIFQTWSRLYNVTNELALHNNEVNNRLSWSNWEQSTYSGELRTDMKFSALADDKYRMQFDIHPGVVVMADTVWNIDRSSVVVEGSDITVDNFMVWNDKQYFLADGKISKNPDDRLSVKLNQLQLSELDRILFHNRFKVFGKIDGSLTVRDYYKDNLLYSDIAVEDWGLMQDTLGTLNIRSYWDSDSSKLLLRAENQMNEKTPFRVSGGYAPASKNLDVGVNLEGLRFEYLEKYISDYFSESRGSLSGEVHIKGHIDQPNFSGRINLDSVALKIRDLNTTFFMNDQIVMNKSDFVFKDFALKDTEGHVSVCNGSYQFWPDIYDLNIVSDRFLLMNAGSSHRDDIYGKLYVSGVTRVHNRNGLMEVAINARPESNSELYIPLTSADIEENSNILHFVNTDAEHEKAAPAAAKANMSLNANLEINDNLRVHIVFDPLIGDILQTRGSGDMKLSMNKDGSLSMFGDYTLSKGNYVFTLGGLFDKNFVLKPGGRITWNGSPYEANLDVSAAYNLKTSLYELLSATTIEDKSRSTKVPVECVLNLSDNLVNPTVRFDINFPSLDVQTKSYVQSLFSGQDEINKQMLSLLILNRFYKPDYMADSEADDRNVGYQAGMTTASELVSNQLSRWLSTINNNFDIDFYYRPGDEITADEIELALSTQLLNDRIILSANGNIDVRSTKNSTSGSTNSNNIAGDFDMEVKLNKQGSLRLKAYSHTDEKIIYKNNTETIQGVGISYQEDFDTFKELMHKYFRFLRKKEKKKTKSE